MGLIARILAVALRGALSIGVLVLVLFGIHLLISRALPEFNRVVDAIERTPEVERRLAELGSELEDEQRGLQNLEKELDELSADKLRELSSAAERWQLRLEELAGERRRLSQQLEDMRRERDEYCSSLNPLKRWTCRELKQRFSAFSERIDPLLARLQSDIARAEEAVARGERQLAILNDETLSTAQKLDRLGVDGATMTTLRADESRTKIQALQSDLERLQSELEGLRELESSRLAWLLSEWDEVKFQLLWIAALVLLLPFIQRTLNYFVLMPLVSRWSSPLHLAQSEAGDFEAGDAKRSLPLTLGAGELLRVRSEYARPVQGSASSQLLYDWRAPFISYAAGLRLLTQIDGDDDEDGVQVTLAAPKDPNSYLMRLDFDDHPGIVIHPKHLVGVVGSPRLRTRWRLFSVQAWATWQLRYILFEGSGGLIVEGIGDVVVTNPGKKPTKIEQPLVMGFDARLTTGVRRTEVFLPYLFGKTPLVDDVFSGEHSFLWQKSSSEENKSVVAKTFDAFFSAIGKLLGF